MKFRLICICMAISMRCIEWNVYSMLDVRFYHNPDHTTTNATHVSFPEYVSFASMCKYAMFIVNMLCVGIYKLIRIIYGTCRQHAQQIYMWKLCTYIWTWLYLWASGRAYVDCIMYIFVYGHKRVSFQMIGTPYYATYCEYYVTKAYHWYIHTYV